MRNFYFKGTKLELGKSYKFVLPQYQCFVHELNKYTAEHLVLEGVLTAKEEGGTLTLQEVLALISKCNKDTFQETMYLLDDLRKLDEFTSYHLICRYAQKKLEEKYTTPIESWKDLYLISLNNFEVRKAPRNLIYNYKCVSFFRSEADALQALNVLKEYINGKSED